ncbi:Naphthalene 1,2-dioxygenase/salicylate 5-hydroxylase systems, ferredoxin component [Pontiella desulfatans]|uniref:Naphthalene 1,2-dioxygenase/salicylate 5-hydroxylase systems, ferredoxin component n=1 Tax=Pontiella desulfatans TaxID=2750659 RepID=A0A6C2U8R5_PONDE|nr:fatty acid desaturase [Pontiella desulfatans]VGO15891.1 Naphthalene 1,2-dioxygenase/salicylate 5-hydroxylase systems, ferredoxin component [Pontiella desulfatans]
MTNPHNLIIEEEWYKADIDRREFKTLMQKDDIHGIINTTLWIASLLLTGALAWLAIPHGLLFAIPAFLIYGMFYCACDARWHESSHNTVFKTQWMNTALNFFATAMQQRDIVFTTWSHARHHSYTVITEVDPEITVTRPPKFWPHFLDFFSLKECTYYFPILIQHTLGIPSKAAKEFVPEEEYGRMFFWARLSFALNLVPVALAVVYQSWIPLLYFIGPKFYANGVQRAFVLAQHAGLDENVWDHRANSRTIKVNPLLGFLYMNMQYHIEHHMHPLMPFHALPKFHERVKEQLPAPYKGMWAVYKEMLPALKQQAKDTTFFIKREIQGALPERRIVKRKDGSEEAGTATNIPQCETPGKELIWHPALKVGELDENDSIDVVIGEEHYAVYQLAAGDYRATEGVCTHEFALLANGVLQDGCISCPKHNAKYDVCSGKVLTRPGKRDLATYPVRLKEGMLELGLPKPAEV